MLSAYLLMTRALVLWVDVMDVLVIRLVICLANDIKLSSADAFDDAAADSCFFFSANTNSKLK